jgi:hypothetical protein
MTLACAIIAVLIIIAALGAVADKYRTERDWHAANAERLATELDAAYESLSSVLDEHALCPAPMQPQVRSVPIARPDLRIIPPQSTGEHDRLALSRAEWDAIERETREL